MADLEVFPENVRVDAHRGLRACSCGPRWIGRTPAGDSVYLHRQPGMKPVNPRPLVADERVIRYRPGPTVRKAPPRGTCGKPVPEGDGTCAGCGRPLYPATWSKSGLTHSKPSGAELRRIATINAERDHVATASGTEPASTTGTGRAS